MVGVRGKRMTIEDLKEEIDDIYTVSRDIIANNRNYVDQEYEQIQPFPLIVLEYYNMKYAMKPQFQQRALNLVYSIDFFKKYDREIKLFSKFLNEEYELDELIKYIELRYELEKFIGLPFKVKLLNTFKKNDYNEKTDKKFYFSPSKCLKFFSCFINKPEDENYENTKILIDNVMNEVINIINNQKEQRILMEENGEINETFPDFSDEIDSILFLCIIQDNIHNQIKESDNGELKVNNKNSNEVSEINDNDYNALLKEYEFDENDNEEDKVEQIIKLIMKYHQITEINSLFNQTFANYRQDEQSDDKTLEINKKKRSIIKKTTILVRFCFDNNQDNFMKSLWSKGDEDDYDKEEQKNLQVFNQLATSANNMKKAKTIYDITENMLQDYSKLIIDIPTLSRHITMAINSIWDNE